MASETYWGVELNERSRYKCYAICTFKHRILSQDFLGWYQISIESTGYHILLEENNLVPGLDPAEVVLMIAGLNLISVSSFP